MKLMWHYIEIEAFKVNDILWLQLYNKDWSEWTNDKQPLFSSNCNHKRLLLQELFYRINADQIAQLLF